MSDTKDDLGQEIPGEVWHTAMRFTGLRAARRIVWLTKVWRRCKERMRHFKRLSSRLQRERDDAYRAWEGNWRIISEQCNALHDERDAAKREADDLKPALDTMAKALDAKTREADELRAQRDRAEALCQEQATLIKQLEGRLRQATQSVGRSTLPTVPPRVGYRYERRDRGVAEIVEDRGCNAFYRFVSRDDQSYTASGTCGFVASRSLLDLVREIGPIEQGDKS